MKKILLTLLLGSQLFAYDVGNTIPPSMVQHLNIGGDKVYVIDFFASWCASCQKEIPLIAKANRSLDHTKVEIIGIDVDQNPENAEAFQKELKAKDTLNFRVVNDPQNLVISTFNPVGMPTLYYVKDQKVMKIITGAVDAIDQQIQYDLKTMR
jgi:thiol-disulfide isomerase/thioredoxin